MSKTKKQPVASKQEILVNVILDRSGSMASSKSGTISGYNEYLGGLRADKESKYNVSLVQFDASATGPELTVSYTDKPLDEVKDLTSADYDPRGSTPLFDAIGECVRRVDAKGRAVFTVIITDGMENASREFTRDTVKQLIASKEAEGWKFIFLGANIDSYSVAASMGVAAANVANYAVGNEKQVYATMAEATRSHSMNVRSHGLRAAVSMDVIGSSNRMAMVGGQPAAQSTFPKTLTPKPSEPKRTKWAVRG